MLLLYAFAVPWEYSLDLGEPFGNVARIVGILLLMASIPWLQMRGEMRRPGPVQWLVLAFYLYFVCSYLWTVDQLATLEKWRSYFQVMLAVWVVWEIAETAGHLRALLRAFLAGCWVLAILTFLDFASASALAAQQIRFVASGQDPNDVARFLDLGFPLAALLFATEQRWPMRLLAIGYVPAGLLGVLLTASRGGVFGGNRGAVRRRSAVGDGSAARGFPGLCGPDGNGWYAVAVCACRVAGSPGDHSAGGGQWRLERSAEYLGCGLAGIPAVAVVGLWGWKLHGGFGIGSGRHSPQHSDGGAGHRRPAGNGNLLRDFRRSGLVGCPRRRFAAGCPGHDSGCLGHYFDGRFG